MLKPEEREKLESNVSIGIEADRVIAGQVFEACITAPQLETFQAWTRTEPEEKDKREDLYQEYRALEKVRRRLTNASAKGKEAMRVLEGQEG